MIMKKYDHLDKFGRWLTSVHPDTRELFNTALSYAKRLGFNRSKFVVMAVIMAALDLGMDEDQSTRTPPDAKRSE